MISKLYLHIIIPGFPIPCGLYSSFMVKPPLFYRDCEKIVMCSILLSHKMVGFFAKKFKKLFKRQSCLQQYLSGAPYGVSQVIITHVIKGQFSLRYGWRHS